VEVVLAIGVFAFALLAVFALVPVGLNTSKESIQQTESAHLISMIEADIRATPKLSNKSSIFGVPLSTNASSTNVFLNEDGSSVSASAYQTAKYRLTLTFPGSSGRNAIPIYILATWPAAVSASNAPGRLGVFTTLDRN
jgi:uncharacterized protein (TIGR02598 family)